MHDGRRDLHLLSEHVTRRCSVLLAWLLISLRRRTDVLTDQRYWAEIQRHESKLQVHERMAGEQCQEKDTCTAQRSAGVRLRIPEKAYVCTGAFPFEAK